LLRSVWLSGFVLLISTFDRFDVCTRWWGWLAGSRGVGGRDVRFIRVESEEVGESMCCWETVREGKDAALAMTQWSICILVRWLDWLNHS
jgi:hypothetical protein